MTLNHSLQDVRLTLFTVLCNIRYCFREIIQSDKEHTVCKSNSISSYLTLEAVIIISKVRKKSHNPRTENAVGTSDAAMVRRAPPLILKNLSTVHIEAWAATPYTDTLLSSLLAPSCELQVLLQVEQMYPALVEPIIDKAYVLLDVFILLHKSPLVIAGRAASR